MQRFVESKLTATIITATNYRLLSVPLTCDWHVSGTSHIMEAQLNDTSQSTGRTEFRGNPIKRGL